VGKIELNAKVLINPFCRANCSILIEDLSNDEILNQENIDLQFSSPFSKNYMFDVDEDTSGQRLYRTKLECNTTKTILCYVANKNTKSRTEIISVNHELNDMQKIRQEELKNRVESINDEFYIVKNSFGDMNFNFYFLNLSEFENESQEINNISYDLIDNLLNLNNFYKNQEYYETEELLPFIELKLNECQIKFTNLNSSYYNQVFNYNNLVYELNKLYNESLYLNNYNFSNNSILLAENYVNEFNSMIISMKEYNTIEEKSYLYYKLLESKDNLTSVLEDENLLDIPKENLLNNMIYPFDLFLIQINNDNHLSDFSIGETYPICCLRNECYKCINDSSINYPIILIHGHSFNEKISAELSMEAFSEFSKELERDGYVDAGNFYGSQYDESYRGYLGKINNSVVLKTTYYIDTLISEEGSFILESKGDDIETYADRLNEIISNVKYLTGKDKVVIVAHSMGGLVTRKYIQKYGEDNLDKVVLVGIPNHGVDGRVMSSCPIFGADAECEDLYVNSLFLENLSNYSISHISVYNIIGKGCIWENSDGDGIVKENSAYLEGVENIYVNGICEGLNFFHVDMIKPSKYPEIYDIIKSILKD
jgi:hypothetical protein